VTLFILYGFINLDDYYDKSKQQPGKLATRTIRTHVLGYFLCSTNGGWIGRASAVYFHSGDFKAERTIT